MNRKHLSSSAFLSAGYNAEQQILEAEFKDGDVYQYQNVPDFVWDAFIAAPSKGRFFAGQIRDRYDYTKIESLAERSGMGSIGKKDRKKENAMIRKDEIKSSKRTAREDPPEKRYNSRQNKVRDQNDSSKREHADR